MLLTASRDIDAASASAECVVRTHERLVEMLRPGLRLAEIDSFVARTLDDLDCTSAFLGYRVRGHPPYPSYACLSVNDCIVHGTHNMSERVLEPGDLLSIDIGVRHHGFMGDAAWTYAIAERSPEATALMEAGKESLRLGIEAMQPGRPLLDWARAVQGHVERQCRLHLVRGLGGHGYGKKLHGPPFIANSMPGYPGEWPDAARPFEPGMLLAVEPMLAIGTTEIRSEGTKWPIFTADGSLSVHYEADVLISAEGPRNLTEAMVNLPDVVGH